MDLKPKLGLDNLTFGMSKKEVYEVLGMPDRKRISDDDDDQQLLEYNDQKLRLTIYKNEDNRLGYLQTSNPKLEFNGHAIINSKIDFVKDKIFGDIISDWEIEDYDFFATHSNDDYWITLNVEFGIVINIEIGVPFNDDNDYDWPN
ncbi:hypothetical protein AWE51_22640 [Aquimarina aggregata]|uniref:Uncharacterized protein n=1 Tax=Aquimarina aggregata TaxID=1642818 RepID=A0A163BB34_9FLAO|nr:hypothetical protein [Aquimarina aggregata]KZS41207.1 hypothetical protein AWE51_22640 [Aquimarina aggregata]